MLYIPCYVLVHFFSTLPLAPKHNVVDQLGRYYLVLALSLHYLELRG